MKTNAIIECRKEAHKVECEWKGGLFAACSGELFHLLAVEPEIGKPFAIGDIVVLPIDRVFSDGTRYADAVAVMKDSRLARFISKTLPILQKFFGRVSRFEARYWFMREGEKFPPYTISYHVPKFLYFTL